MLTLKKRLFLEHFKVCRNATKAALTAGYSAKTASKQASFLLKDEDIASALKVWEAEEAKRLVPSKDSFVKGTFEREKECTHWPTRAKLWETGGRALGYLGGDSDSKGDGFVINIITNELNLDLKSPQKLAELAQDLVLDEKSLNTPLPINVHKSIQTLDLHTSTTDNKDYVKLEKKSEGGDPIETPPAGGSFNV